MTGLASDPRQHLVALTEQGRDAVKVLRALGVTPEDEGEYLSLAVSLAVVTSDPPTEAVAVLAKIAAQGVMMPADLDSLTAIYPLVSPNTD